MGTRKTICSKCGKLIGEKTILRPGVVKCYALCDACRGETREIMPGSAKLGGGNE
jgi:hypothetical protein